MITLLVMMMITLVMMVTGCDGIYDHKYSVEYNDGAMPCSSHDKHDYILCPKKKFRNHL